MGNTAKLKSFFRRNWFTKGTYFYLKGIKEKRILKNKFDYHGVFHDRSKGTRYLCIVLAGYKEFLYPVTFKRLSTYLLKEIDVCIVTSGKYSETVDLMCKENGWSYLSTKENNVSLVQNVAILKHPKAQFIFKLDEDIFITKDYFKNMLRAYEHAQSGEYQPGIIAPLIPINAFGHMHILNMLNLKEYYEQHFEKPLYIAHPDRQSESNPEVAKFFWGENGIVPSIDVLNSDVANNAVSELTCPIRFSIGAILFERKMWEDMGFFKVNRKSNNMGMDEEEICCYCLINSKPIMVSKNVVVGHLSFGRQNKEMEQYFLSHIDRFDIQE